MDEKNRRNGRPITVGFQSLTPGRVSSAMYWVECGVEEGWRGCYL